jgi:hypothetical protein
MQDDTPDDTQTSDNPGNATNSGAGDAHTAHTENPGADAGPVDEPAKDESTSDARENSGDANGDAERERQNPGAEAGV